MKATLRTQSQTLSSTPATFAPVRRGLLQRKCACGGTLGPTGECEECRKKKLQRRPGSLPVQSSIHHQPSSGSEIPPIVHEVLRSPGQPLDPETRAFMEPRFGHDFGHVRIHATDQAARSARNVNALAYTIGRHIVFGTGTYAPATDSGRELIAHELTHTIQQSRDSSGSGISQPADRSEREASEVAKKVMVAAGGSLPIPVNANATIQRRDLDHRSNSVDLTAGMQTTAPNDTPGSLDPSFRLQRAPDEESDGSAESGAPASLLVEDDTERLDAGQMRKSDFLEEVGSTVSPLLPDAQEEAFSEKMSFYRAQDSQRLERDIRTYVPDTTAATAASEYIQSIREHVEHAAPAEQGSGSAPTSSAGEGEESGTSASDNVAFKMREGSSPADSAPGAIRAQLGPGESLNSGVKSRMETAFGHDFSGVRIHTDTRATSFSSGLDARAFTIGSDIAFGAGEYQPGTLIGEALLAHELAHVVQQGGGSAPASQGGGAYENLEEDADLSAVGAMIALWGGAKSALAGLARNAMPRLRSGLRLQRCNGGGHKVIRYRMFARLGFGVCSYCACTPGGCVDQLPGPRPENPCPPGREVEWDGCGQKRNDPLFEEPCATSPPGVRCL